MTEPVQGLVGPASTSSLGVGTTPILRAGQLGELVVQQLHGRYYESTYRKAMFFANSAIANAAPGTTSINWTPGTTTAGFVGLTLSNPITNSYNLVVNKVSFATVVIPTVVQTVFLAVGFSATTNVTHTTPVVNSGNCFVGSATVATAKADTVATVPVTPTIMHTLQNNPSAITIGNPCIFDMEGSIVLPPGGYMGIYPLVASSAAGWLSGATWEEVPV